VKGLLKKKDVMKTELGTMKKKKRIERERKMENG